MIRKLILMAAMLAMLTSPTYAAYGLKNYRYSVIDLAGNPVTDTFTATVYIAGSTAATVYADESGTAIGSTLTGVTTGAISFWYTGGNVDIQIAGSYATIKVLTLTITDHVIVFPMTESLGNVSAGTITASSTVTLNGDTTIGNAVTDTLTVTAAIQGANAIYFDGATDNTIETIFAITDPTSSDKTITFPDASGAVILSTGGVVDTANAIWGASNSLLWEGATANAYELTLTVIDPAADVTVTLPATTGTVVVSPGGGVDYNTGFWGIANGIVFEGATADSYETTLTVTDTTVADKTITLPNETGLVVVTPSGVEEHYAVVDLTNVNIKALRATPISLIAAPGSGKVNKLIGATLILNYGANVLTAGATDDLVIEYADGQDITASIEMVGFIDQTADTVAIIYPATITAVAASAVANKAIQIKNTGSAEFGGNAGADTVMRVIVHYMTLSTGL